jgi:transcriptional regulator GlxA family with amidase domain
MSNGEFMIKSIHVVIIDFPNAMQSAVQGLKELLILANQIMIENDFELIFEIETVAITDTDQQEQLQLQQPNQCDILIIPPSIQGTYCFSPNEELIRFIQQAHSSGAIICSACAGTFILAETGLLNHRPATTHWKLAQQFEDKYPDVKLEIDNLLINDGELITAGGLMSWTDLGLEIVAQFSKPHIMRVLGKYLIVDTGKREQRYYGSFNPIFNHGNKAIITLQHYLQAHYSHTVTISDMAETACMSERTLLRQFKRATGFKPTDYMQRLRVQKACDLLESTQQSFELIAHNVGYEDANSFRKVFVKIIGLTPSAFKQRFV